MRQSTWSAVFIALPLIVSSGCSDNSGVNVVDGLPNQGDHTAHTDVEQGVWPPQPLGMSNEQTLPARAKDGAMASVIDAARGVVMNNPNIRAALGADYIEFDGSLGDNKSDITANFLFYSYTHNETVDVFLSRNGEVSHESFAAASFQPTEHATEVTTAIELGGSALTAAGFEVAGLTGTAMLAFPPASESTDLDQQYYPQRVMYVTFGAGDGELPVYSALVNLSSETVSDSGLIK